MTTNFPSIKNIIKFPFDISTDEGLESYLFKALNEELVLITNTSQKNGFKENIKEYLLEYVLFKLSRKCDSVKIFKQLYPVIIQHLIYFGLIKINNLASILMESKNQRCLYCLEKFTNTNIGKTYNRDIFCNPNHKNDFKTIRKKFFGSLLALRSSSSLTVEKIEDGVNEYLEGLFQMSREDTPSVSKPIQGEISDWFEYLNGYNFVEKTEKMILEKIKVEPTILENDDLNSDLLENLSEDIIRDSLAPSKRGRPKKNNFAISSNEEAFNSLSSFLNLQFSYQKLKVERLFLNLDHFVIRRPIGSLCLTFYQRITLSNSSFIDT